MACRTLRRRFATTDTSAPPVSTSVAPVATTPPRAAAQMARFRLPVAVALAMGKDLARRTMFAITLPCAPPERIAVVERATALLCMAAAMVA